MLGHQPTRVLRIRIEVVDAFQRLLERRQDPADRIDLRSGGRGQRRPLPIKIGIETLDHLAVGQVCGRRGGIALAARHETEQSGDADRNSDRREEAEHADRLHETDR